MSEAEVKAKAVWNSIVSECVDDDPQRTHTWYYSPSADSGYWRRPRGIVQFQGVHFYTVSRPVSPAEAKNGIQWHGATAMIASLYHNSSSWEDGEPFTPARRAGLGYSAGGYNGYDSLPAGWFVIAMVKSGNVWHFNWAGTTWVMEDLADRKPSCAAGHGTPGERKKQEAEALAAQKQREAQQAVIMQQQEEAERKRRAAADAVTRSREPKNDLERDTQASGFWMDPGTGLWWTNDDGRSYSWRFAEAHCGLPRFSYSDWRLPTIEELNGIYNPTHSHDFVELGGYDQSQVAVTQYHVAGGLMLSWPTVWSASTEVFSFRTRERFPTTLGRSPDYPVLCVRGPGDDFTGTILTVGGDVSAPSVLFKVDPEYSEEARKAKVAGIVALSAVVDTTGTARNLHVVTSLGFGLDEKVIEAVLKWKFKPSFKAGEPVNTRVLIEVNFRLLDPPKTLAPL